MSDVLKKLLVEYDKKRQRAKADLEDRKEEIYGYIPRIREIDRTIRLTGLELARTALTHPDKVDEITAKIKEKVSELKSEKAFLLTESNIPISYLEIHYECEECNDTGYTKGHKRCTCLLQSLINIGYKNSNIGETLERENFDNFDITLFSEAIPSTEDVSPKDNMKMILSVCESFVYNFRNKDNSNLLFYGPTGLGKTYLCNCVAKALLDRGNTVIYQTAFRIIDTIESYRFASKKTAFSKQNYDLLFTADLLIIDDLGTEMLNSFSNSEMFNIINTRLLNRKKTIISSNLSPIELRNIYNDRITSRMFGNYELLKFFGKDLRWER